jgi:hypothetical protein
MYGRGQTRVMSAVQVSNCKWDTLALINRLLLAFSTATAAVCSPVFVHQLLTHGVLGTVLLCPAGKGAAVLRELEGKLYAGHETFDWLLSIVSYILSAEVCV